jgi:hypothetical protein
MLSAARAPLVGRELLERHRLAGRDRRPEGRAHLPRLGVRRLLGLAVGEVVGQAHLGGGGLGPLRVVAHPQQDRLLLLGAQIVVQQGDLGAVADQLGLGARPFGHPDLAGDDDAEEHGDHHDRYRDQGVELASEGYPVESGSEPGAEPGRRRDAGCLRVRVLGGHAGLLGRLHACAELSVT